MDDSGRTKYPVLFRVYGGPGSQMVDGRCGHDWHDYLVAELQYIVVVVDGRGTGFRGRALRNPVKNNLGRWETVDQIAAAKVWAAKEYVDPKRIGIWGWSYGGFMSSKVIEADAGVHSLAMAVAVGAFSHSGRDMPLKFDSPEARDELETLRYVRPVQALAKLA